MEQSAEHEPSFNRSSFDRSYWLGRCEGFRVESSDGRVGVVAEVLFSSRIDRPDALVLRAGLFGRRTLVVPVDEIAEISPREKRVTLVS
jgi:hypothetical protein